MAEEKKIDLSQFREKFVEEAKARLSRMNGGLVYLEKNPGDAKLEGDILREAHTLKGAARMLGFSKISELSLRFEEALARRRDGKIHANKDLTDSLFLTLDTLSRLVGTLGQTSREPIDVQAVIDRLKIAQVFVEEGTPSSTASPPPAPSPPKESPASPGYADRGTGTHVEPERLEAISNVLTNAIAHQQRQVELRDRIGDLGKVYRRTASNLLAAVVDGIHQGEVSPGFAKRVAPLLEEGRAAFQEVGTQLSELRRRESVVSGALAQNLEDIRSEFMSIRMIPLSPLFDSFQSMAGGLARDLGKEAEILVRGGKTEIDRKVAEALAEPLTHVIRNAVDHGIESPEARSQAGKPRKGRIVITATPKKGRVVIEVEDDGKGIDPQEVRETAIRKGLISEKAAYRLDDRELLAFVFRTGFSTAKKMTELSGRGIGMDVVRNTAERFNGTAEIFSTPGKGTRLVMELPLSMAVSRVLLFLSGEQYFAIPVMHADGVRRFTDRNIVTVEGRKSLRVDDVPVPVVWLNRLLGLPDSTRSAESHLAIMVRHSQRRLALVVDRVEGESEVVVRDLGKYLGKVQLFMGTTILGTGDVALLLDVYDLVSAVRMHADTAPETTGAGDRPAVDGDILVVEDSLLVREMQQRVLTSAGFRVETASSGKAALELLSRKRFHAILAGARMAGMDGIELLSHARKADHTREVPFILVASPENRADLVRGMAAGAQACVTTDDFTAERLTAMIGRVVSRRRRG